MVITLCSVSFDLYEFVLYFCWFWVCVMCLFCLWYDCLRVLGVVIVCLLRLLCCIVIWVG